MKPCDWTTLGCLGGEAMSKGNGDSPGCHSVNLAPSDQTQLAVRIVTL